MKNIIYANNIINLDVMHVCTTAHLMIQFYLAGIIPIVFGAKIYFGEIVVSTTILGIVIIMLSIHNFVYRGGSALVALSEPDNDKNILLFHYLITGVSALFLTIIGGYISFKFNNNIYVGIIMLIFTLISSLGVSVTTIFPISVMCSSTKKTYSIV